MSVLAGSAVRLLGPSPSGPVPAVDLDDLLDLVAASGLTGRDGAGFPTARKLRAVTGTRPVVVGNAMEGEPLSHKDAVLLGVAPGLVVDGLLALGHALDARRLVLATGPGVDPAPARAAAARSAVEARALGGGFLAGQESALVNALDDRAAVPSDPLAPVWRRGVGGHPTLVLNAETLAQLGLVLRHGPAWFRAEGTPDDPGTSLVTVTGSTAAVLTRPGVLEVARGTRLRDVLGAAGADPDRVRAVLVGGYHGAWVDDLDVALSREALAPYGASPGAGVLHLLDRTTCPLRLAAEVGSYLAAPSARQCGPCVNGLPALAATLAALARPGGDPTLPQQVERVRRLVTGRGACAHPDGSARFAGSTLRVFADHVGHHLEGRCA